MKILFYVEPHPIRNTTLHFADIAQQFSKIVKSHHNFDVKLFLNTDTLAHLNTQKHIQFEPHQIITTTRSENEFLASMNIDWISAGQNLWLDLLKGGEIAQQYLSMLKRIYQLFPFDIILYWGENGAIRLFQKEKNFTAIGMELGCTRPPFMDSLVMDPYGTNGAAVIPKLTIDELADIVNHETLSASETMMRYSGSEFLPYEQQFLPIDPILWQKLSSPKPKVFFPLQLADDANLIKFSPYSTLVDVVLDVVPKLVEKGYQVILKPHPAAKYRHGCEHAHNLVYANLIPWMDSIIWCNDSHINYNHLQLMQLADFVVTVNSSVGFESLFFDKPCVVLGEAIYKPQNMFPTLDEMLAGTFDQSRYLINSGYLRKFFLEAYLSNTTLWNMPEIFLERMLLLHRLYQSFKNDFYNVARGIFLQQSNSENINKNSALYIEHHLSESSRIIPKAKSSPDNQTHFIKLVKKLINQENFRNRKCFIHWLEKTLQTKERRLAFFNRFNFVDEEYYFNRYKDVANANYGLASDHYAYHGIEEGRSPNKYIAEGFNLTHFIETASKIAERLFKSQESTGLNNLSASKAILRENALEAIRKRLKGSNNKVLAVAHLYYVNLVPEILTALKNIPEDFDLIITMPTWGTDKIVELVSAQYPDALFYPCENRGRDIAPFIDLLPIILEKEYESAVKLHTKNGFFYAGELLPDYSQLWRKEMLSALLGSREKVANILHAFRTNKHLNMVGAEPLFVPLQTHSYSDDGDFASNVLDLTLPSENNGFFAGTMFWFRPEAFKPLIDIAQLSLLSFGDENGAADGELAHIIERAFGHLSMEDNGIIAGVSVDADDIELNNYLMPNEIPLMDYFKQRKLYRNQLDKERLFQKFCNHHLIG